MRDELIEALIAVGISKREQIEGCSEAQVDEVEASFGRPLPASYREFLLTAGQGAGRFMLGTDFYYPYMLDMTEGGAEILVESNEKFSLPPDAFVFSMHQGYQFMFFRASEGDDPPVYYYYEGEGTPRCISDSFSGYLFRSIEEHRGQS
jgi:hypothetical protein